MMMHQPPQNSCKLAFPDRCRNELGSNKTCLFMFNSFYYDCTLAEAAKNAAQPHCGWVPKMKVLEPPQNSFKKKIPGSYRKIFPCLKAFIMNDFGLMKQPKLLPSHIVLECQKWRCSNHHSTPTNKSSLSGLGMSLVQMKHTSPCLTAFIMT